MQDNSSTYPPQAIAKELKNFPVKKFLGWFMREKRGLPWRQLTPTSTTVPTPALSLSSNSALPKQITNAKNMPEVYTRGGTQTQTTSAILPKPASIQIKRSKQAKQAKILEPKREPYAVWILETMLQQTQIKTVLPYYERWIRRYPDVFSLAETTEAEALRYFQGLGYYRRLRSLLKGARMIVGEWRGQFPSTRAGLLQIPGIGYYTAGAILAFAFHKRVAVVDGNIVRVLSRYFMLADDKQTLARYPSLAWYIMKELLPKNQRQSARFNEAMMELGSVVCKTQNPRCLDTPLKAGLNLQAKPSEGGIAPCPLMEDCKAFQNAEVLNFPIKARKLMLEQVYTSLCVIEKRKKFLLVQRRMEGRLAGMWEFPSLEHHKEHSCLTLKERERLFYERLGIKVVLAEPLATLTAHYTRYRAEVIVYTAKLVGTSFIGVDKEHSAKVEQEINWVSLASLKQLGLSSLQAKVRNLLTSKFKA